MDTATLNACAEALRFQLALGADACVEEAPVRWQSFGLPVNPAPSAAAPPRDAAESVAPSISARMVAKAADPVASSVVEAVAASRTLADAAADLPALEQAVRGFEGCALKKTATHTVFAQGVATSRLVLVGEAPGAEEDRQGVPFCGASGQLLDRMLAAIGLSRETNCYITNVLFWRPPGNRAPTPEEIAICLPLVEKHLALLNPRRLVLLGGTATQALLGESRGITRLRGQVFSYQNTYMDAAVPTHVLFHPSYLLRQPLAKKQSWADLLALKAAMQEAA